SDQQPSTARLFVGPIFSLSRNQFNTEQPIPRFTNRGILVKSGKKHEERFEKVCRAGEKAPHHGGLKRGHHLGTRWHSLINKQNICSMLNQNMQDKEKRKPSFLNCLS